jgi:hypothetical protein
MTMRATPSGAVSGVILARPDNRKGEASPEDESPPDESPPDEIRWEAPRGAVSCVSSQKPDQNGTREDAIGSPRVAGARKAPEVRRYHGECWDLVSKSALI